MIDTESLLQSGSERSEQRLVGGPVGYHQMRRERNARGRQGPDVQVVNVGDAALVRKVGKHGGRVDARGNSVEREVQRVAQKSPGAHQDHRHDQQAHDRIEPIPAREQDQRTGDQDAGRYRRVSQHVDERTAPVQIIVAAGMQQPGGEPVEHNADRGNGDDRAARDGWRRCDAPDRLPGDRSAGEQQEHGIRERREHGGAPQPVGEPAPRRTARQDHGGAGAGQPEDVAQVVAGVRDECHRVGQKAECCLDHHEA
jgi:hypothetical protein